MSTKREQLVETAERLFYREGFYATGVDRVIAEAGVARMTLYKHFPSKDELVLAVLAHREQSYWEVLDAAVDDAKAHDGIAIRAVVEAHVQWLIDEGSNGCLLLKALGEYAAHSTRVVEFATGHKQRFLAFIRGLIREDDLPSDQLAEPLVLILEGATAYAQVLPAVQVAEQVRRTVETLIKSAKANSGGDT